MKKTGKILLTYDVAKEYKFKDIDGMEREIMFNFVKK